MTTALFMQLLSQNDKHILFPGENGRTDTNAGKVVITLAVHVETTWHIHVFKQTWNKFVAFAFTKFVKQESELQVSELLPIKHFVHFSNSHVLVRTAVTFEKVSSSPVASTSESTFFPERWNK